MAYKIQFVTLYDIKASKLTWSKAQQKNTQF